jgi:hypothetical protein
MNDKNELYRIQMQLDEAQLAAFLSDMLELHEQLTDVYLNSGSGGNDFPEANAVIDRIRRLR